MTKRGVPHSILLCRRYLLNSKGIIKETMAWEVLADILLDKFYSEIGVVDTLDFVSNTGDWITP